MKLFFFVAQYNIVNRGRSLCDKYNMEHTAGDLWGSRVFTQLPDVFVLSASLCSVSVFVYCSLSAAPRVGYCPVQKESLSKEKHCWLKVQLTFHWPGGKKKKSRTTCMSVYLCEWITACLHTRVTAELSTVSPLDWTGWHGRVSLLSYPFPSTGVTLRQLTSEFTWHQGLTQMCWSEWMLTFKATHNF